MQRPFATTTPLPLLALLLGALPGTSHAQMRFSVDWNGPTVGSPACGTGVPMTEGDLLRPCSGVPEVIPAAGPTIAITGGAGGLGLSLHAGCVGHAHGTTCGIEVDAFSSGRDRAFLPQEVLNPGALLFSVDAYATGLPGLPAPSVTSESLGGDSAADLFGNLSPLPPGPLLPFAVVPGNVGVIDGDGLPSASIEQYPGLGLFEPTYPTFDPNSAAIGDDLDAFDDRQVPPTNGGGSYFSLDGAFQDPCSKHPNGGSAAAHGFSGADVLRATATGPVVYAPATLLGLDVFGAGSDDLDALLLRDNGDGVFSPSQELYQWVGGGADMLLFSVRRGSEVIGKPDSLTGTPIEEGDILMPPVGSLSPFPSIFIAAENLGLATQRSGAVTLICNSGDDLDALDRPAQPIFDCNENGVEDALDIALGLSEDTDGNGRPDECEPGLIADFFCFCDGVDAPAPCGNIDPTGGCENSTGTGARLGLYGTSDVAVDDLVIVMSDLPAAQFGLLFMGDAEVGPFALGDGLRCVGGTTCRFPPQSTGALGEITYGPGIAGYTQANFPASCHIDAGTTWSFQGWFRDAAGPCGTGFNTTNAATVTFY